MLELELALLQNELNHDAGDEGKSDGGHEHEVISACSLLNILELLVDWVRSGCHIEVQLRVTGSNTKDSLEHVLWIHGSHIL